MLDLLKSASKIVFILVALSACVGLFVGKLEAKEFMILASMAFSFYFSNKGDSSQPFAGK